MTVASAINIYSAEIYIFCIVISFILYYRLKSISLKTVHIKLGHVIIAQVFFFLFDLLGTVLDGININVHLEYSIDILYFFFSVFAPYLWLKYVIFLFRNKIKRSSLFFIFLPTLVFGLLLLSTFKTSWIFSISEKGVYTRGSLYFIQPVLSLAYFLAAFSIAIFAARHEKNFELREKSATIAAFGLFPTIAAIPDILFPDIPFICPVSTIGLILLIFNIQKNMISTDSLTRINNRFELRRYMHLPKNEMFSIIFMDIDKFKAINDINGHLAGDEALIRVAKCIEKVCKECGGFAARYGGDEFVALIPTGDEEVAEEYVKKIKQDVLDSNEGQEIAISVSAGSTLWDPEKYTPEEILDIADKLLYVDKKRK